MLDNLRKELEGFALNVIASAKGELQSQGKVSSGRLKNSLEYEITEDKGEVDLSFYGEDYAMFVDKGVQGANPSGMPEGAIARYNKAPMSPYRFSTGSGKKGLRGGINKWLTQKGIKGVRDDKGRFLPRKSMIFLMSRSVYLTGMRPSFFFTKPFERYRKGLTNKLMDAYGIDIKQELDKEIKNGR